MTNPLRVEDVDALLQSAPQGAVVHLVGIGGCGVSGLAHLLLDLGLRVSGSDLEENDFTRALRLRGAEIQAGHGLELVRRMKPALVAYSPAVRANNPELAEAEAMGVPIVRRAVLLAAIVGRRELICVAGMHGKTTTTALLAFALEHLDIAAGYAVGAAVPQLERHARFNPATAAPALFACEADESDGTLCAFSPTHSIVLNVDAEHLDYYSGIEAVTDEFARFSERTKGRLVFCADDERLARLFAHRVGAVSYGFNPLAAYRAEMKLPEGQGTRFEVWHHGLKLGDFRTPLLGEKNVSNVTAVIALLHQIGCDPEDIARAIEPFRGAARRQELKFSDARFQVYDDYAHHPREVTAVLGALRTRQPRRVLAVFQPHRFTRTQRLMAEFAGAFQGADRLWVTEVYPAGETPLPGVNGAALADAIRATGQPVECLPGPQSAVAAVRAAMQPGDMVVFLGAGDITAAAAQLAAELSTERAGPADELVAALAARLSSEGVIRRDEPLAKRTTLRVGGSADFYAEPADERDLSETLRFCRERGLKFTVLGRGSNLLIRDGGIRGMVICLAHPNFSRVEVFGDSIRCGAGAAMKNVAIEARKNGLAGLEFLEGIPGNVGGGLRMNAGAMGKWMFEAVETLWYMDYDGAIHEARGSGVNVEYRGCPLLRSAIALGVVLKGEPAEPQAVADVMKDYSSRRWETQPKQPSAGCIFKNPSAIPAGRLIEELGLKGTRIGGAMVSEVHGNFIVNTGEATAGDVLRLIDVVKQRARAARGIELETEVEILGE